MTAPFEKAKAAGYRVEPARGPRGIEGWEAIGPDDVALNPAALWPSDGAAWEACDNHRMFGDVRGVQAEGAMERDGEAFEELHDTRFDEPPQAVRLETRRVVVLPTGNLSLATCQMLQGTPLESWPVAGGIIPHGFYVYAHDEGGAEGPADLQACCTWANKAGFDYIQFDCDADTFAPGLPVYDHNPRPPVDALEAFAKVRELFATWEGWSQPSDSYAPGDLLEAIAEAVGAPLNGKPAAPVAEDVRAKCERYNDALGELGISPNGEDFNALLDFAEGRPYRAPEEDGR